MAFERLSHHGFIEIVSKREDIRLCATRHLLAGHDLSGSSMGGELRTATHQALVRSVDGGGCGARCGGLLERRETGWKIMATTR